LRPCVAPPPPNIWYLGPPPKYLGVSYLGGRNPNTNTSLGSSSSSSSSDTEQLRNSWSRTGKPFGKFHSPYDELSTVSVLTAEGYSIFLREEPPTVPLCVTVTLKVRRSQHEAFLAYLLRTNPKKFNALGEGRSGRQLLGSDEYKRQLEVSVRSFLKELVNPEQGGWEGRVTAGLKLLTVGPGEVKCCCKRLVVMHGGAGKIVKAESFIRHAYNCGTFAGRLARSAHLDLEAVQAKLKTMKAVW